MDTNGNWKEFRFVIEWVVMGCLALIGGRLVSYIFAVEWYPLFGAGSVPPFYVRLPIVVTIAVLAAYWILMYRVEYKKVVEDTFAGLLQLGLSWIVVFLCFEVAVEMVQYWVLSLGVGASVAYFKNRQLYRLLSRLGQHERSLRYKRWKNVAAPYALSGLGIGALAWFLLSLSPHALGDAKQPILGGLVVVEMARFLFITQVATHYICAALVGSFVGRALYLAGGPRWKA